MALAEQEASRSPYTDPDRVPGSHRNGATSCPMKDLLELEGMFARVAFFLDQVLHIRQKPGFSDLVAVVKPPCNAPCL